MATPTNGPRSHAITLENVNPCLQYIEYVSQGPLLTRTREIELELQQGVKKPFTELIKANIGDCQAMGQPPITYVREVLALLTYPPLLDDPRFPEDVKARARAILAECGGGSIGAYTDKKGIEFIRKRAAQYIEKRDGGIKSDYRNVILTGGSTMGIKTAISLVNKVEDGKKPGIMGPIPQYPLYSATVAELNMEHIGYYLDEANDWELDIKELKRAIDEAKKHCNPRAIAIINPGNPTGQVLSRQNIEEIIKFAYDERLVILTDEVYQINVYAKGSEFHSFKKVLTEMGSPYNQVELASFMSASKGCVAECGFRGGYVELTNFLPEIHALYMKATTIVSCPSVIGQAALDCVLNPPLPGEPSYALFVKEKEAILTSLAERAKMVADTFNSIEGVTCNIVQGSMYAYPQITIPPKAIAAAKAKGYTPDYFYVYEVLEKTGVCILPGAGFGQRPGTYHIRTTILPQMDKLKTMLEKIRVFHAQFLQEYK